MIFARNLLAAGAAATAIIAVPASAQYYNSQSYGYQSSTPQYPYGYNQYNGGYTQNRSAYSQYPNGYSRSPYGYNAYNYNGYNRYNAYSNSSYGYRGNMTAAKSQASQQCTASVQNKLQTRSGLKSVIASLVGAGTSARVTNVTGIKKIRGRKSEMRVTGLASSGNYGPYGVGAYGATAYSQRPDMSFTCDVDRYGRVQKVDINRL